MMTLSSVSNTPPQPQRRILQHRSHKRVHSKTEREAHHHDCYQSATTAIYHYGQGLHNGYVSTGRLLIQYRTLWVAVWAVCSSLAAAWRSLGVEWIERSGVVLTTRRTWKSERWASISSYQVE
jgi:hypothetical protein